MQNIKVKKYNGDLVPFNLEKLKKGLLNSGTDKFEIDGIVTEILDKIYDGISTRKLHQIAYRILRRKSNQNSGRYRLKNAILELGPSGFPFEEFVARLFAFKGYEVKVGQIINGMCVTHEVDVVAKNGDNYLMIECKHHRNKSTKNDVKIPLYINSRFEDIKNKTKKTDKNANITGMIVTNTRFSSDAIRFSKCAGLKLISWDYPANESLKDIIDKSGFHPITSLSSLKKQTKKQLLEKNIVLCRELIKEANTLKQLGLQQNQVAKIINEATDLIKI